MNKNMTAAFLAATMLAVTAVPLVNADATPYDDMQTATGPGSLDLKLASVGLLICDPLGDGSLLPCGGGGFNQDFGGVIFDVGPMGGDWDNDLLVDDVRLARFWAEWDIASTGVFPPAGGGFDLSVCSDRDDDGSCTNIAENVDNLAGSKSNSGIIGKTDCNKDKKDCGDPTDAEVYLCVQKDTTIPGLLTGPGNADGLLYDDLAAFIGIWVGDDYILNQIWKQIFPTLEGLDTLLVEPVTQIIFDDPDNQGIFNDDFDPYNDQDNIGAGISLGSYNIYLEYDVFYTNQDDCLATAAYEDGSTVGDKQLFNLCEPAIAPDRDGDGWADVCDADPDDPEVH